MKENGTKTRYPGVYRINVRKYRITGKYRDPRTGKERWINRLLEGVSAQEAVTERKRALDEAKSGGDPGGGPVMIGDFARSWLESKGLQIDVTTFERYGNALKHALQHFGEIYYHTLRPGDVQAWIDSEIRGGFSPETIRGWFSVFRTMTRDAVFNLDLPRDPTQRIRLPEKVESDETNAFTTEELVRFLSLMRERYPQHYALIATMALTGLRFCHVSALKWEDVDFETGTLAIRRKQARGVPGPVSRKKRAPKVYPIGPELLTVLQWHRREYPGLPKAWVFPSRVGKLRKSTSSVGKAWDRCLAELALPHRVTPHGLRHTFTDLMRHARLNGVLARSLGGWETERMLERYSTVRLDEQRSAVDGIHAIIRDAASKHESSNQDDETEAHSDVGGDQDGSNGAVSSGANGVKVALGSTSSRK